MRTPIQFVVSLLVLWIFILPSTALASSDLPINLPIEKLTSLMTGNVAKVVTIFALIGSIATLILNRSEDMSAWMKTFAYLILGGAILTSSVQIMTNLFTFGAIISSSPWP